MPYILISTQIRLETGPTTIGDAQSDHEFMMKLGGRLVQTAGNNFKEWLVDAPVRIVLNSLAAEGYKVVGTTGIGQTAIWTLFKQE